MGINMTSVHADTATPVTTNTAQTTAQGTAATATGDNANPQTSTEENAHQQLTDEIRQAQDSGVNVTKSGTKVINGTNAADAEKQAVADYQDQARQVKKARDEQEKSNTQSQDEYNKALEAYKQALKDKGYPVKDGALTGNDVQQNLVFGDEPNVAVNVTVADDRLTVEVGNDINYKKPTFPSQGSYHEIVFKDGNSTAVNGELGEFTFTNLQNSFYEGKKISKVVVSFANLRRDGLTDGHFGKHCVVVYDNLTKGLEFAGTSIDVTYRLYDENGQLITLNSKDSYIVPASLNNHGSDKGSAKNVNIESVELLSDGKAEELLGSSVSVDGKKEYSNHYNDGDWDQSVTDDPHGKRTYGSGLFNVSGDHVTLRFYTQLSPDVENDLNEKTPDWWNNGSMWAIVQTVIPTYDNPVPPVKKNSNANVAWHDVELHVKGSQHVTIKIPDGKTTSIPDSQLKQSYEFIRKDNDWGGEHQFAGFELETIPGYHVDSVTINGKTVEGQVKENQFLGQKVTAANPNADVVINYAANGQESRHEERTVTRTINIKDPRTDETKTIKQTVTFTRDVTVDAVIGEVISCKPWSENGSHTFEQVDVPVISGYKPTQSSVSELTVTPDDKSTTVNISYTANEQTTHIVYQDKTTCKRIKVDPVAGKTGKTVSTNSTVPDGWQLVHGQTVPKEITFTGDQTPDKVVIIEHAHKIVKPGDPQPTGELPGDHSKNYPQLEDLLKNVHFTVHITDPRTGEVTTKAQEADFVRQADIDEVTDEVTYTKWQSAAAQASADGEPSAEQSFLDVDVPTIPGYTAHSHRVQDGRDAELPDEDLAVAGDGSMKVNGDRHVTADTPDKLVEVTYTANQQSGKIIYVDPDGKPVAETPISGKTDQTIPFTPQIPAGYELVPGQNLPTEITFNGDGQPVIIKVKVEKITARRGGGQTNADPATGTRLNGSDSRADNGANGQHGQQLPQTGNEATGALAGLGLMGITLGMFGFKKKQDN